jgi:hypothetical protein
VIFPVIRMLLAVTNFYEKGRFVKSDVAAALFAGRAQLLPCSRYASIRCDKAIRGCTRIRRHDVEQWLEEEGRRSGQAVVSTRRSAQSALCGPDPGALAHRWGDFHGRPQQRSTPERTKSAGRSGSARVGSPKTSGFGGRRWLARFRGTLRGRLPVLNFPPFALRYLSRRSIGRIVCK